MSKKASASAWLSLLLVACGPTSFPVKQADPGELPLDSSKPDRAGERRAREAARPRMNAAAAEAFAAGGRAFRAGDLQGARAQFERAVSADPRSHQAQHALGVTYERQGDYARALQAQRAALELLPDFEPAILAVLGLYLRQNQAPQADSYFTGLRAAQPDSAAVLTALAEVKSVQQDSASAQSLAQQALKRDPDFRPAMVVLARDHYRARRLDLALYTLTAILDGYGAENPPRDKNNAEARLIRALIYKEQGRRNQALAEFQRVVELRPDIVEARLNLAAYMLEAGNADGAVPLLEGALAYEPANPLIHLNLGDAYRLQGRSKDALTQLDWVTQAAPNLAQAHYNIGLVYLFGKLDGIPPEQAADRAIAAFERCAQLQPGVRGGAEDVQELISRAKNKKAVLEAMKESSEPVAGEAAPAEPAPAVSEPEPAPAEQPEPESQDESQPPEKKPSEASMSEGSMSDAP